MTDKDLPAIQYLMREVFGKRYSLEYLAKKYDTAWAGLQNVAYLAFHQDAPVAMYGALAQRFRRGNETLLGVHTCDSFTLSQFQGQGLHRELALQAYETMRSEGVQFVYAYHSEATFHACKKLDWQEGPHLIGYWVETGKPAWSRLRNKLQPDFFPRSFHPHLKKGGMHNSHQKEHVLHVDYAPDFFQYKSFTPNAVISDGKAHFWVKSGAVLMVGDGYAETDSDLKNGVDWLKNLSGKAGFGKILFQAHPESALNRVLPSFSVGFQSWLVGYCPFSETVDWKKWRGNFGDLDTF